jgi:3-hydroxyanthranilate 3,4-dioxygenase
LFYQLEGDITVKTQQEGQCVEVKLSAGDMFLLPPRIPHNPSRSAGSIGLVIERVRKGTSMKDGLLWFCEKCNHSLHSVYFSQENIENDFLPRFKEYYGNEDMRTCKKCGHVMETDPRFV